MMVPAAQPEPDLPVGRLRVAKVVGVHGLRGTVKLQVFTVDPENVMAYGPVTSRDGQQSFRITLKNPVKGHFLAHLTGVTNRNLAEPLIGMELFIDRSALPKTAVDEFYEADLIGLRVDNDAGETIGVVRGLQDFGAGQLLDIRLHLPDGDRDAMVPFTLAAVPVIDLDRGVVVVNPPDGLLDAPDRQADQADDDLAGAEPDDLPDEVDE